MKRSHLSLLRMKLIDYATRLKRCWIEIPGYVQAKYTFMYTSVITAASSLYEG